MSEKLLIYLKDINAAIANIEKFIEGLDYNNFWLMIKRLAL